MAENTATKYTAEDVIRRIDNKRTLAQIALNNPDFSVRTAAIRRIDSVEVLERIVRKDKDPFVRMVASKKLTMLEEELQPKQ
jgi:hypothetical protein